MSIIVLLPSCVLIWACAFILMSTKSQPVCLFRSVRLFGSQNYMFFIPMTIPEIAASAFFPVTVWTPGGAAIIFVQSWNSKLKFFLDITYMKKIGSGGVKIHFLT